MKDIHGGETHTLEGMFIQRERTHGWRGRAEYIAYITSDGWEIPEKGRIKKMEAMMVVIMLFSLAEGFSEAEQQLFVRPQFLFKQKLSLLS